MSETNQDSGRGSMTTRVCLAVAFVALIVGAGAAFMPVDHCGVAVGAFLKPKRVLVFDGPVPTPTPPVVVSQPYGPPQVVPRSSSILDANPNPGTIYRSEELCKQEAATRLIAAMVGSSTVVASVLGAAVLLRGPRGQRPRRPEAGWRPPPPPTST